MSFVLERAWEREELLGLPVDLVRREDVVRAVPGMVRSGRSHHLVALNPIKVMRSGSMSQNVQHSKEVPQ